MNIRKAVLSALCLLATPVYADTISGYVHADGTVDVPSSLYTVTHPKPGQYVIQFTTPMTPKANCVVTLFRPDKHLRSWAFNMKSLKRTDVECSFVIHSSDTGSPADSDFSFIAMPMSN